MKTEKLLSPLKVGAVTLPNRVFMAPLTRLRSIEPGDIPTPLMAEYYAQRASAGLIVTEATQISFQAKGYAGAPGLHTPEQIAAWKHITQAGLMIQIDDFWVFCAFLFPILVTMQMLKLQNPPYAALWGQLIVFMGSFLTVSNPPSYDYQSFINDNIGKIVGVLLAGLAFQILRPSSDKRKSRRIIRALRRDFIDQLSKKPQQSESQFESLIYHRISQLNQSQDQEARTWLLRWGVVLLNCSHIVWQLRDWQTRSDPLSAVRNVCIHCLRGIMTEKGVQHSSLDATLQELLRMSNALAHHPEQAARDLAGLIWRLYCSLQQLQQTMGQPAAAPAVSGG